MGVPDGRSLMLGYYLVAFVDVLGQREQLRQLTGLPRSLDRSDPIIRAIQGSWGVVDGLRKLFVEFFAGDAEESEFMRSLPPPQREALREVMKWDFLHYTFSDSIIIAVPLTGEPSDPTPVNGVWSALTAVATNMTLSLAAKHALRGGIDVGVTLRVSEHEVYGAALERAYTLESRCADHPRILVGDDVVRYLRSVTAQPRETPGAQIAGNRSESALRLIFTDTDGRLALDYLGSEIHEHFGASFKKEIVQQAYAFVVGEQARWKTADNEKLDERYRKVRAYFESRADVWGIVKAPA